MLGIVQEQHPDRTRLFMQWKEMRWPILVDSLDLLEVDVVPLTFLIDEHGVIRYTRPTDDDLEQFLATEYAAPADEPTRPVLARAEDRYLWGGQAALDDVVEELTGRIEDDAGDAWAQFRLGVALRRRYDSVDRRAEDFQKAVAAWGHALALDPNQYIWRRRIQQYGPRLDKPYPFYDWVGEARATLEARGETPPALVVEPRGAEFAAPSKEFVSRASEIVEPDPEGRILRDDAPLIVQESVVVPGVVEPGGAVRVHLVFRPDLDKKAHWNNEVDDLIVWVTPPPGWRVDQAHHRVAVPREPVSQELRSVEFELDSPEGFHGSVTVPAYALYYICEDVDGTCLFRRRDVPVTLTSTTAR